LSGPLAGSAVLVTRPEHQTDELVAAIKSAGGEALAFPVLRIEGHDNHRIETDARSLPAADIVVFTSRNAVEYGFPLHAGKASRIAAIGPATARAIEAAGGKVDIRPGSGFDSEQLLQSPELQSVAGRNIRIVRGDKGRELLADTLRSRGARVDYLSVYRRLRATPSPGELQQVQARWQRGDIRAVIIMSVESFDNLAVLLPANLRDLLRSTPLVTPSRRVIQTIADKIPGSPAFLATGPQAADMLRALINAIAPGIRHEPEN
jgi:uroporphyrinogen-III synthase